MLPVFQYGSVSRILDSISVNSIVLGKLHRPRVPAGFLRLSRFPPKISPYDVDVDFLGLSRSSEKISPYDVSVDFLGLSRSSEKMVLYDVSVDADFLGLSCFP